MSVGMPETLWLQEFGSYVWDAFGEPPYHVGSSLLNKTGWRDVDVRLMLDDETYKAMGFGDPVHPSDNGKWVAMCLAFSELGRKMTGLPIDFQIQSSTWANEKYPKTDASPRSCLGFVPSRIRR